MFPRLCIAFPVMICFASVNCPIHALESLGDVHFPTSCRLNTQGTFDTGVALLHSFEFREAEAAFREVEREDPKCVIAAWGIALSTTERAGATAPQRHLAKGWAELKPWLTLEAKTEREQLYVNAVRDMYEDYIKKSGTQRWSDYLALMRQLQSKHPDDINALLL